MAKKDRDVRLDQLYRCLSRQSRREVIRRLESTDSIEIEELSEELAGILQLNPDKVHLRLRHLDLPKLDDANIIDYEGDTIEKAEDYELARGLLPS